MVQFSGSVNLEINNSTAKKSSFKNFSVSSILEFCQSTNQRGFSPIVQYSVYVHLEINSKKNPALKIFQCVQFLQFCQSTNLRGFSPMVQYSGYVNLEINNSTGKKFQL